MRASAEPVEYLPLPEAAKRLGLSPSAVRRRLAAGRLQGRREERPQGHVWLIAVPVRAGGQTPTVLDVAIAPAGDCSPDEHPPEGAGSRRQVPVDRGGSRQVPVGAGDLATLRARELADYTERLIEPWRRRLEAQAEQIGEQRERIATLERELAQARAQAATSVDTKENEGAAPKQGRRWWAFLWPVRSLAQR